jgi:hypothetical protein
MRRGALPPDLSRRGSMVGAVARALIAMQNADGGWGTRTGGKSATEPTAFALLALRRLRQGSAAPAVAGGLGWLVDRQRPDGGWPPTPDVDESGWTTSLAVFALATLEPGSISAAVNGCQWLLRQRVYRQTALVSLLRRVAGRGRHLGGLDARLAGWPWVAATASWVEPTAYALLALKKVRTRIDGVVGDARIVEAEAMLLNRRGRDGGWNYGNAEVLGESLPPFPDVTAVALIALRGRVADTAASESLATLARMLDTVRSGLSLGWGALCFALYGRPTDAYERGLATTYETTGFLGDTKSLALAVLASSGGADVFAV